jgi:biopolymer transport protein ExbB/TolQ
MTEIGSFLSTIIYLISASLLYPVLVLLVVGFLWVVVAAGAFCAEWLERVRLTACPAEDLPATILGQTENGHLPHRVKTHIAKLRRLTTSRQPTDVQIENLVQDATIAIWKTMDRLRIMVRLGPSLGLMGTLIPMGTGLAALGQGDMARLSSDLVIAFTTTVVGLAIGMLAYVIYTVKRRWVEEDIKNIELATEMLAREAARP